MGDRGQLRALRGAAGAASRQQAQASLSRCQQVEQAGSSIAPPRELAGHSPRSRHSWGALLRSGQVAGWQKSGNPGRKARLGGGALRLAQAGAPLCNTGAWAGVREWLPLPSARIGPGSPRQAWLRAPSQGWVPLEAVLVWQPAALQLWSAAGAGLLPGSQEWRTSFGSSWRAVWQLLLACCACG